MRQILVVVALGLSVTLSTAAQRPTLMLSQLTWFNRSGTRLGTLGPLADHGNIELSPTGAEVASAVLDRTTRTRDLWVYPTAGAARRVASSVLDENWMVWSAGGQRAIVNRFGPESLSLLDVASSGTLPPRTLAADAVPRWPVSLSPDGRNLLFVTNHPETGNDIWVLPTAGTTPAYPFQRTEAAENWATFSPDGRFVAFSSNDSGTPQVFVTPFPGPGPLWPISSDTGTQARWRRPNEIVYIDGNRRLVAVTLEVAPELVRVVRSTELFGISFPYGSYHAFDVTSDGARLLVNTVVVSDTGPSSNALEHRDAGPEALQARR